jgi:ribonuclease HII
MPFNVSCCRYIFLMIFIDSLPFNERLTVSAFASTKKKNANNKKNNKLSVEHELHQRGYKYIIGTDEVGRGAIAGPVLSTSCCIFHHDPQEGMEAQKITTLSSLIQGVHDSKQISETQREIIYQQVLEQPSIYKFACAQRSPSEIDEQNILRATMECFQTSIQNLILQEGIPLDLAYAICDGESTPKLVGGPTPIPCRPMVGADAKVYVVSLASIIAKVTRDRIMVEAHNEWPHYNFHLNKGYSTRDHIERIHKYGPCPLHRMSFKALKYRSIRNNGD